MNQSVRMMLGSLLFILLLGQTSTAFAAMNLDAIQILRNLAAQLDPWARVVSGASFVMGTALFFKALYHLKVYGELRTMMSRETSLKTPLTWMVVGAMFIYLPSTIEYTMKTTFGESRLLLYSEWTGGAGMGYIQRLGLNSIFKIVQFVGFVSFIRGLMIITKAAQQGAQQHTFAKGFTHVLAGIFAMNVIATLNMAKATLGIQFT